MLTFACSDGGTSGDDGEPVVSRTLIVYMGGGEKGVSKDVSLKLNALKAGMPETDARVVIYVDDLSGGPRLYTLVRKPGQAVAELKQVRVWPGENSADPAVFGRVIRETVRDYPARSYGLLVFSHASGWLPKGAFGNPSSFGGPVESVSGKNAPQRTIVQDGTDEMEFSDFATTVPGGVFDYMVFETCFMGGVETAYELKDKTRYLVGSAAEIVSPGFTEVYPQALRYLLASGEEVPAALVSFAEAYFDAWNIKTGRERSATIAVVDCSRLEALAEKVRTVFRDNRDAVSSFDPDAVPVQRLDRFYGLFRDFAHYLRCMSDPMQYAEPDAALREAVIYKAATPGFFLNVNGTPHEGGYVIETFGGLSCYIPAGKYPELDACYGQTSWAKKITRP